MKGTGTARKGARFCFISPQSSQCITIASDDKAEGTRWGLRMGNVTGKNTKVPAIKRKTIKLQGDGEPLVCPRNGATVVKKGALLGRAQRNGRGVFNFFFAILFY